MMKKTILITGISGVLGGNLVKGILEQTDYNIISLTANVRDVKAEFKDKRIVHLNREDWFNKIDRNIDISTFINCGFPRTSNPLYLAKGINSMESLIKRALQLNVKNIINISSQSVYSQRKKKAADELTEVCPESLYGMTKYSVEKIIDLLCEKNKEINYSHIRLGSLVNSEFKNRMPHKFMEQALNNKPIQVNGSNLNMSYLHVNDAVNAILSMLHKDNFKWGKVYNLGSDKSYLVKDIANTIKLFLRKTENRQVEVILSENESKFNNLVDSTLFFNDFNWRPTIYLEEFLSEAYKSITSNYK